MKKKMREKKQPAGKLVIALVVLVALVFMLLGPKAKAENTNGPVNRQLTTLTIAAAL
ncbi:MAG: hypothetical protein RLZZ630_342 [Bacteroidota bacterium]|jgi:hypothetical protein